MLEYIVTLLLIISQCNSRCTFEHYENVSKMQCDTLSGLEKIDVQNGWCHVLIKSFGDKATIESSTFRKIRQVYELTFENSVNDIKDFSFTGLSALHEIHFERCTLPIIKKNWFSNLHIKVLGIIDSKVTTFQANCFEGSNELRELRIMGNNISRITANVFSGTFIKILVLERNSICFIEENAFANMAKLMTISLEGNFLSSFDPKLIMGSEVSSLYLLFLANNTLKNITENNFVLFPNISAIYLDLNELESMQDGAFNGLPKLEDLHLSGNKLKVFPEGALPYNGLPSLKRLMLHNNRFNYLPRSFVRYFPKLQAISIFRNPWQCACYKTILNSFYHNNVHIFCAKKYLNGQRPVCVVPRKNSDTCTENIPNANNLYKTYIEAMKEYEVEDPDNCKNI